MTPAQAAEAIYASGGRFFHVEFRPRDPSSPRRAMNARLAVRLYLSGGHALADAENGTIRVQTYATRQRSGEIKAGGFRKIPVEGITSITIDGVAEEVRA